MPGWAKIPLKVQYRDAAITVVNRSWLISKLLKFEKNDMYLKNLINSVVFCYNKKIRFNLCSVFPENTDLKRAG